MKLDLFDNAVDSLKHGLEHLSDFHHVLGLSDAKQAVMNLVNAIDLLVLEKLRQIDENSIFEKEEEDAFGLGYRKTIRADEAYKRIRKHLNKPIEGPEWDAYQILKILRNSATHFEFSFGKERKDNIVFLLHYIARFMEDDLGVQLEDFLTEEEFSFYLDLIKDTEFGDVLFDRFEAARIEAIRLNIQWMNYRNIKDGGEPVVADFECAECHEEGVSLDEELAPVGKCAFCGYEHKVAFCERCGYAFNGDWEGTEVSDGDYLCDSCWSYYEEQY